MGLTPNLSALEVVCLDAIPEARGTGEQNKHDETKHLTALLRFDASVPRLWNTSCLFATGRHLGLAGGHKARLQVRPLPGKGGAHDTVLSSPRHDVTEKGCRIEMPNRSGAEAFGGREKFVSGTRQSTIEVKRGHSTTFLNFI